MYTPQKMENVLKLFFNKRTINKVKCLYCSLFLRSYFRVSYRENYFEITLNDGIILKFVDTPFLDLLNTINGYFKNHNLNKGDYVVDGGAYAGVFAIYAAKIVGNEGKVIAFEPDAYCFGKLQENIKVNNVNNIIAVNKGLWNKNEALSFDSREGKDSAIVECLNEETKGRIKKYDFVKLDDELEGLGLDRVDFIKMDIEGAEIEALDGCTDALRKNKINLAIASYHVRAGEKTCVKLEPFLKNLGYEVKTEYPKHLTTYAYKR